MCIVLILLSIHPFGQAFQDQSSHYLRAPVKSAEDIPLKSLKLYLWDRNIRLASSITTLFDGASFPNKTRSLEIPSLFPSKARRLKYSIDLLKGISLGFNEEIPDSNKLLKTISQLGSTTPTKARQQTYLEKRVNNKCNVILPSSILQTNWVYERRKEPCGVHNTRHVGNSTGSHLVGKKLSRISPEGSPPKVIRAVAKEDGDNNTNRVVPCAVFGVYCVNWISILGSNWNVGIVSTHKLQT